MAGALIGLFIFMAVSAHVAAGSTLLIIPAIIIILIVAAICMS